MTPVARPARLPRWCEIHLGARPQSTLWESGHLSWVGALALADGREVVVKVRRWSDRLVGCHQVHSHLWASGFPCPEPLTGPTRWGDDAVSAEAHAPGGTAGDPADPRLGDRTAQELRRLIEMASPLNPPPQLDPPPPWTGWNDPRADPWPPPDEGDPLNADPRTVWLRPLATALTARLRATTLPPVAGHADWYQANLRWADGRLVAAHDWDSVASLPEAAFVGCAAVSFLPSKPTEPDDRPGAEVRDSQMFIDAYSAARGRSFDVEEQEVAWAAGLWQRVFDAAKSLVAGRPESAHAQIRDADERGRLAGL